MENNKKALRESKKIEKDIIREKKKALRESKKIEKDIIREKKKRIIEFNKCLKENNKKCNKGKIDQYDLEGVFIKTWDSSADIYRIYNRSLGNIHNCCVGRVEQLHGFIWKYSKFENN